LRGPACLWCITYCVPTAPAGHTLTQLSSRQLVLGTHGPAVAHGGTQSIHTWDSRGPAVLLTAHASLYILGTHGPDVAHGTQPIHTWDSRPCCCSRHKVYTHLGLTALLRTICAILSSISARTQSTSWAYLFLEHLCTLCLELLCALCLENLCALSLGRCALRLGHRLACTPFIGSSLAVSRHLN
jgi:hypothetical protein